MTNVFKSLLLVIAGATQKELARQIKYLKVENEIMRSKLPKRIIVTPKERQRLIRFGQKLGKAMRHLPTIIAPKTLLKWISDERKGKNYVPVPRGRRQTPIEIRRLILKLARENQWGYTRILGELKKLGIYRISRNTVKRILKDVGLDPGPKRGEGTWDEFIKQHAASLWQCDFFSKRILTTRGIREAFVLVFLNVKTRRVVISPASFHPKEEWAVAQAKSFVQQARDQKLPVAMLQRDLDSKFGGSFDQSLKSLHVRVLPNSYRSPNTNAFVERFIQTIKQDCLDHFVVFGEKHLNHLCAEFLEHYHAERPHQSLGNEPITRFKKPGRPKKEQVTDEEQIVPLSDVRCKQRLGGLLKSYSRRAA